MYWNYIYLDQEIQLSRDNYAAEINRKKTLGWESLGNLSAD